MYPSLLRIQTLPTISKCKDCVLTSVPTLNLINFIVTPCWTFDTEVRLSSSVTGTC